MLALTAALALAGLALAVPGRPVSATDETFFQFGAPCPIAHCDQRLDGNEGLSIPVSVTPTVTTTYTPASVAYNIGLGCTAGPPGPGELPNIVACSGTKPSNAGSATESFLYDLTATTSTGGHPITSVALATTWVSAGYTGLPTYPCTTTTATEFPVDHFVSNGAPLFSDVGTIYVSDDHSIVKYNPGSDSSGYGTCNWARQNPDQAALISWNAVHLPTNPSDGSGYQGQWYVVGQGDAGPVVLADMLTAVPVVTLTLSDSGGKYATYNTIAVVQTATGARLYDSTQQCPSTCMPLDHRPGRLYAIDVTAPSTAGGTPTMAVAWSHDFEGPSGASPMVLPGPQTGPCVRPCGDQIYFDGSGNPCGSSCSSQPEHPTLFGLLDSGSVSATAEFTDDLTTAYGTPENGYCPNNNPMTDMYEGMQAAAVLEAPETGGSDPHYSVWAHVACGPNLYRFDANTGALWSGSGASTINIPTVTQLDKYVPGSTMQTVTDSDSGDVVAFLGVNLVPANDFSYVTALDLETGSLLWKVNGPSNVVDTSDTPFHGQFPIAETACGSGCTGYVLIAATAGAYDGAHILGLVLHGGS